MIGLLTGLNQVGREQISEKVQMSVQYRRDNNLSLGGRPKTSNKRKISYQIKRGRRKLWEIREQTGLVLQPSEELLQITKLRLELNEDKGSTFHSRSNSL